MTRRPVAPLPASRGEGGAQRRVRGRASRNALPLIRPFGPPSPRKRAEGQHRQLATLLVLLITLPLSADLIVVLAIDQLRFDYVDRFAPWFTTRGFRRFASEGAIFPNARFNYSITSTGPGHAAIGSGLTPAESGITGNRWFERDAPVDARAWEWYFNDISAHLPPGLPAAPFDARADAWWQTGGSPRYCVYDDTVEVTAGNTTGMSPRMLDGDSLGERVKERHPPARVVSVGMKDSSVILMGGRRADAAYWFDYRTPAFISSSYYRYNTAVFSFNALLAGYIPASARWVPSPYIPAEELERVTFDPPAAWPLKNTTYEGTFPHPIESTRALTYTPFMHQLLFDFAYHVIATENLGASAGTPDLLFVAISSTDYIGHYYGPDSKEVADSMVRLDRSLAAFLDALERRFGERVTVALTSDHGVQPSPEIAKLRDPRADAGRVDIRTPVPHAKKISDLPPIRVEIEEQLARRLGVRFDRNAPIDDALVYFFEEPGLWLNWPRVEELRLDPERTKSALRDVMRSMKHHGLADAWTSTELLAPKPNLSRLEQLMRASIRLDRSGDVLMALRPGWMWHWGSNSTTHGQPVENDLRVPLLFWGAGIKPGTYDVAASPLDVAPTLGKLAGVEVGGRTSRALPCVE